MNHLFFKRIFMAGLTACLILPVAGMAQQGQDAGTGQGQGQTVEPGMRRHRRMARRHRRQQMVAKRLNLTDEQKQQMKQISQTFRQQAQAIRNDTSLSDADKKQKLQDLRKQTMEQHMGVLTPEQQQELKKLREERRNYKGSDKTSKNNSDDDDLFAEMTSEDGGPAPSPLL